MWIGLRVRCLGEMSVGSEWGFLLGGGLDTWVEEGVRGRLIGFVWWASADDCCRYFYTTLPFFPLLALLCFTKIDSSH